MAHSTVGVALARMAALLSPHVWLVMEVPRSSTTRFQFCDLPQNYRADSAEACTLDKASMACPQESDDPSLTRERRDLLVPAGPWRRSMNGVLPEADA